MSPMKKIGVQAQGGLSGEAANAECLPRRRGRIARKERRAVFP